MPKESTILRPVNDKLIVTLEEFPEQTEGGLILPQVYRDRMRDKLNEGTVLAVGPGRLLDSGERSAPLEKVGDRVVFNKNAGIKATFDGQDCIVIEAGAILAVKETVTVSEGG